MVVGRARRAQKGWKWIGEPVGGQASGHAKVIGLGPTAVRSGLHRTNYVGMAEERFSAGKGSVNYLDGQYRQIFENISRVGLPVT